MFSHLLLVPFIVFLVYVLSIGPVAGFYHSHLGAPGLDVFDQLYAPLTYLCNQNDPVGNALAIYVEWWWPFFE